MDMGILLFWGFVALLSVSIVWASYLSRRERERTIRRAIEEGAVLDAETIRGLDARTGERMPVALVAGGLILLGVAAGTLVFAYIIAPEEPDTFVPLLGIAAFVGIPAAVMSAVGVWLMRRGRRD